MVSPGGGPFSQRRVCLSRLRPRWVGAQVRGSSAPLPNQTDGKDEGGLGGSAPHQRRDALPRGSGNPKHLPDSARRPCPRLAALIPWPPFRVLVAGLRKAELLHFASIGLVRRPGVRGRAVRGGSRHLGRGWGGGSLSLTRPFSFRPGKKRLT